jgi:hypothetical protein
MQEQKITTMNNQELKLWNDIQEFELDDDEHLYTFSDRLAKENGWSKWFTLRVIDEYKKFMFLICSTNQPLTPSEPVDQVWHLHLLYTRSYWKQFCPEVLKREVHHGPTRGGPEERDKFTDWYAQTLHHYRIKFNCDPPTDLWPRDHLRFESGNFRWIDLNKNWIIKKLTGII